MAWRRRRPTGTNAWLSALDRLAAEARARAIREPLSGARGRFNMTALRACSSAATAPRRAPSKHPRQSNYLAVRLKEGGALAFTSHQQDTPSSGSPWAQARWRSPTRFGRATWRPSSPRTAQSNSRLEPMRSLSWASAVPHDHDLVLGYYSVHTSADALREGRDADIGDSGAAGSRGPTLSRRGTRSIGNAVYDVSIVFTEEDARRSERAFAPPATGRVPPVTVTGCRTEAAARSPIVSPSHARNT